MPIAIRDMSVRRIDGAEATLAGEAGKVLLVVNVASKCGKTPQYAGLEALHERFRDRGFAVLGFPCNQFGGQEPGTNAEIAEFCRLNYGVSFPMFARIDVRGPDQHPLYAALVRAEPKRRLTPGAPVPSKASDEPDVRWNFEKFLIGRDGDVIARYDPDVTPDDPHLVRAVEAALAASG